MSGILDDYKQLRMIEITKQLQQLKAENKHLNDLRNQALKEKERAEAKLEEIKEIASDEKILLFADERSYLKFKDILQIISEVEE